MKFLPLLSLSLLVHFVFGAATTTAAGGYDPLALPGKEAGAVQHVDFTVHDAKRNRDIPVRVFLPPEAATQETSGSAATSGSAGTPAPVPVVIFSHGLGGSREGYAYLGEHWAGRGYITVNLQHAGSDTGVWKDVEPSQRMAAMKTAASPQNLILRLADVAAVLDQLAIWNKESGHPLAGRLDLEHVGMAGHSFGAGTTQGVCGETYPAGIGQRFTDARLRAAVALSPNIPSKGDAAAAFAGVKIPWMLMTGTKDGSPINNTTPEMRQAVYPALPPGDKYELVLNNAEHSAFSDRSLPGEVGTRNPNHHKVVLALSTAFWDAYLKNNAEAKAWLQSDGPRAVMEKDDRWQRK